MDYNFINFKVLEVYQKCDVHTFPLDCFHLFEYYKLTLKPYSSLDKALYEFCIRYSEDAFWYLDKIFYNDQVINGRMRFSLMHELGHYILNHNDKTPDREQEANYFASNILAPRMVIHYANCKNENDVSNLFQITNECARYAFDDYKRWRLRLRYPNNTFDNEMFEYFYRPELDDFIYQIDVCPKCYEELYNGRSCIPCLKRELHSKKYTSASEFDLAEQIFLYGKDGGGLEL